MPRKSDQKIRIVGIDPGLRTLGLCVLEARGQKVIALDARVIESHRGSKKLLREICIAGDDQRRLEELWRGAISAFDQYKPYGIAIETYAPIRGRAGNNAWKIAVVYGMLHGIGLLREIAVFAFLPTDLKR